MADSAESVEMTTDRVLLGRVVANLLRNALEAIEPKEAVTLDCRAVGDSVQFAVHNPTYMPLSVQMQIFDRSFSTKGSGRGYGTHGVKLLTEAYLGENVGFTSTVSEGTSFRATVPRELGRG